MPSGRNNPARMISEILWPDACGVAAPRAPISVQARNIDGLEANTWVERPTLRNCVSPFRLESLIATATSLLLLRLAQPTRLRACIRRMLRKRPLESGDDSTKNRSTDSSLSVGRVAHLFRGGGYESPPYSSTPRLKPWATRPNRFTSVSVPVERVPARFRARSASDGSHKTPRAGAWGSDQHYRSWLASTCSARARSRESSGSDSNHKAPRPAVAMKPPSCFSSPGQSTAACCR